jgi:hypothetical protein
LTPSARLLDELEELGGIGKLDELDKTKTLDELSSFCSEEELKALGSDTSQAASARKRDEKRTNAQKGGHEEGGWRFIRTPWFELLS